MKLSSLCTSSPDQTSPDRPSPDQTSPDSQPLGPYYPLNSHLGPTERTEIRTGGGASEGRAEGGWDVGESKGRVMGGGRGGRLGVSGQTEQACASWPVLTLAEMRAATGPAHRGATSIKDPNSRSTGSAIGFRFRIVGQHGLQRCQTQEGKALTNKAVYFLHPK